MLLSSYEDEVDLIKLHAYRKIIKSIYYSTIMTRFDVIKAVSKLTKKNFNFESDHLHATTRCIQCLFHIKNFGIQYSTQNDEKFIIKISKTSNVKKKQVFKIIIDVFFANESDRRSSKKYIFKFFEEMIDWTFKKQLTISTFITKTEFLTMLHAKKKFIWWIYLFQKFQFNFDYDFTIFNNNFQIIRILIFGIDKINIKFRHVSITQCWLRQTMQNGWIIIDYLSTAKIIVDDLIKLLSFQKH